MRALAVLLALAGCVEPDMDTAPDRYCYELCIADDRYDDGRACVSCLTGNVVCGCRPVGDPRSACEVFNAGCSPGER